MSVSEVNKFFDIGSLYKIAAELDHLDSLGLPLDGRKIYEPGCGIGLLTGYFENRGCKVFSTDVLAENVVFNWQLHPWRRDRVRLHNVEDAHFPFDVRCEVVFAYGLLYHVTDPALMLQRCSENCSYFLVLSSVVNSIDDDALHPVTQWGGEDQGLEGMVFRPARDWIVSELEKHFEFVYTTRTQPRHEQYPTEWPTKDGFWRRAVFVASRKPLQLETLSPTLLNFQ